MIPAALLRFVPHIALAFALLAGVWWLDHRGYQRAKQEAGQRQIVDAIAAERKTRRIERALGDAVAAIDANTGAKIENIRVLRQTVVQTIEKDLAHDPRARDTACALPDSVRGAINAARSASGPPGAAGSVTVALPAAAAAP